MGWRILQISKPCKLSVKNRRLVYEPFEEASVGRHIRRYLGEQADFVVQLIAFRIAGI